MAPVCALEARGLQRLLTTIGMVFLMGSSVASADEYTVGAGDLLSVHVHNEGDLSRSIQVGDSCRIEVGLIGLIDVCDNTVVQIADLIRDGLAEGYLVNPQVTVEIKKYGSQTVQVIGEVKKPGEVVLDGQLSLLEVIVAAGDRKDGSVVDVKLVRGSDIRLFDLQTLPSMNPPIYVESGDTIILEQPRFVYVTGGVKKDGPVSFRQGLTLTQALTSAGGTSEFGRLSGARLVRADGEQIKINISAIQAGRQADIVLMPEDRLIIRGY